MLSSGQDQLAFQVQKLTPSRISPEHSIFIFTVLAKLDNCYLSLIINLFVYLFEVSTLITEQKYFLELIIKQNFFTSALLLGRLLKNCAQCIHLHCRMSSCTSDSSLDAPTPCHDHQKLSPDILWGQIVPLENHWSKEMHK